MLDTIKVIFQDLAQSRAQALRLGSLIAIALFSVYFGFFHFSAIDSVEFIKHTGYYFMMAILLGFIVASVRSARAHRSGLKHWIGGIWDKPSLCLLAALTVYLWISQPIGFKVVMDEINLLGTSMYLHLDNKAMSVLRGYELNGSFLPLGGFVDKRPLFFPFILSLLHDITGYRAENAFALNLFLIPTTLVSTYALAFLLSGSKAGARLSILLVACFPMFNQTAHGGGFETLNYWMIVCVALAACIYLRRPDKLSLSLMCICLVVLANVRYESVLFAFPVGIVILAGWFKAQKVIISGGLLTMPLLLLPVPMLHRVFDVNPEDAWQLSSKEDAVEPFGLQYLVRNTEQAVTFFFDFTHSMPNSVFIALFGVAGCLLFLLLIIRNLREKKGIDPTHVAMSCVSIGVVGLIGLLLVYFWD